MEFEGAGFASKDFGFGRVGAMAAEESSLKAPFEFLRF